MPQTTGSLRPKQSLGTYRGFVVVAMVVVEVVGGWHALHLTGQDNRVNEPNALCSKQESGTDPWLQMSGSSTPLHALLFCVVDEDVEATVDVLGVLEEDVDVTAEVLGVELSPHMPGHSSLMLGPRMTLSQKFTW